MNKMQNQNQMEVHDLNDDTIENGTVINDGYISRHESEIKKSKFQIYLARYKSFIKSPRVHFVYDTLFYTIFLLLFSYMLLCDLTYFDDFSEDSIETHNHSNNSISYNDSFIRKQFATFDYSSDDKIIKKPSVLEFFLIFWIISFIFEEFAQVSNKKL